MSRWYPTVEDAIIFHEIQIKLFGGAPGVRDMGLVEMAIFRPQTGYYKDILEEAAALWESFMMNHPFVDGNKRIAADVMLTFLKVNGIDVTTDSQALIKFIYGLFDDGAVTFVNLDGWLRKNTTAALSPQQHYKASANLSNK